MFLCVACGALTAAAELEKKIRNLAKKIRQITELQDKQAAGEALQANQVRTGTRSSPQSTSHSSMEVILTRASV